MKVWGRKNVTYFVFKVVKVLSIAQIKLIQLDGKVVNYVLKEIDCKERDCIIPKV